MKVTAAIAAFMAVASATKNVFSPPGGLYKVKWDSQMLVDNERLDPFNSSRPRRMMISRFKPVLFPLCTKICQVPYMSPEIAAVEDEIIAAFLAGTRWPRGALAKLKMEVCCESIDLPFGLPRFPKILFGTGLNTTRHFYSATAQQLASIGYEVIVMDHPYETDVVQYPDGELVFGGHVERGLNNTEGLEFGLRVRSDDAAFVMDTFGIKRTVFIGQSFGGAAAVDALFRHADRIMGGVNLDGYMFGPGVRDGVTRPFLIWGSDGHNSTNDFTWANFFDSMEEKHASVWTREISTKDASHGSYSDFSVIGDVTGLRSDVFLEEAVFGKLKGARAMKLMKRYLGDFIDFTLNGRDEGVLKGPTDPEYPDMVFIR
jgi:dienelactone hydrolase